MVGIGSDCSCQSVPRILSMPEHGEDYRDVMVRQKREGRPREVWEESSKYKDNRATAGRKRGLRRDT